MFIGINSDIIIEQQCKDNPSKYVLLKPFSKVHKGHLNSGHRCNQTELKLDSVSSRQNCSHAVLSMQRQKNIIGKHNAKSVKSVIDMMQSVNRHDANLSGQHQCFFNTVEDV